MRILITGGAGFIGSNFVHYLLKRYSHQIIVLDKLTYAGNLNNLRDVWKGIKFIKGDICDKKVVEKAIKGCDVVVNFAAESFVDRSIIDAGIFVKTDVMGIYNLLEAAKRYNISRFLQISCYDEKARALTTKGLKTYKELKKGDRVFSLNPITQEIEVKPIEKIIIQSYKGKMLHFKNKRVDLMITPNHNMFILNTKKKLVVETAEKAFHRSIFYLPEGHWKGKKKKEYFYIKDYGEVNIKDLMYILGIFIGDGFIAYQEKEVETKTGLPRQEYLQQARDGETGGFKTIKKQNNNYKCRCHSYRIFFDIPQKDKCRKRVEKTLYNLGIKYSFHKGKGGEHLYFMSKAWMKFFNQCGRDAQNKRIPRWVLNYPPEYLKYLLEGLMDSDGHNGKIYHTVSKRLVSDICELCIKLNLKPSVHIRHSKSFINGRKIEGNAYYIFIARATKSINQHGRRYVDYNGEIWCLKVKDNKNFIVERNGKFDFCGNTDEVYGSTEFGSFTEESPLMPNNPYSASKAGADLLCRSYFVTHKFPVVVTRSSNNYGPYQHPEKFIPTVILKAIQNKPIPVYGDGKNIRDWIYVEDNCEAIDIVMQKGKIGEIYNVGGGQELQNIEVCKLILKELGKSEDLITFVKDRPGHDRRYSLLWDKIKGLGWNPNTNFKEGIAITCNWYLRNRNWWEKIIR